MPLSQHRALPLLLGAYALLAGATILWCDGTGDAGDSINHYLFARYAPRHPTLFFDHWAKPLFVLLACPFAQFGFTGIKVFNALLSGGSLFFTYRIAQGMRLPNTVVASVMLLASPLFFVLTFSGLTEPMFACLLCAGIDASLRDRHRLALTLISFLPFVRSEGLIIIGVFAVFHLWRRSYRLLPFLTIGTVVYSIAGAFVYHDLLWTFTRIPYANIDSPYGHGHMLHFVSELLNVVGVPIYALFAVGCIAFVIDGLRGRLERERHFLVLASLVAFVVAHSLFWHFGLFNSMGLNRVLVGVAPLTALVALRGFQALTDPVASRWPVPGRILQAALLLYVVIFPFTPNPAAIDREHDLMLKPGQRAAAELARQVDALPGGPHRIIAAHPGLCFAFGRDRFDAMQWKDLTLPAVAGLSANDLVIWDDWFAVVEGHVPEDTLARRFGLICILRSSAREGDREARFAVYANARH